MNDLWPDIESSDNFIESNAIDILREQARILEKKTNGKIKATFSKIDYKTSTLEIISKVLSTSPMREKEEIVEVELEDKKDVNELYTFIRYKFEIYNDVYKFRAFILNYRPIFPIQIEIDEGIREEIRADIKKSLNSDEELIGIVSSIFSSNKLQMIIKRMMSKK